MSFYVGFKIIEQPEQLNMHSDQYDKYYFNSIEVIIIQHYEFEVTIPFLSLFKASFHQYVAHFVRPTVDPSRSLL